MKARNLETVYIYIYIVSFNEIKVINIADYVF